MITILAEKPSVARDIAAFVGANTRHEGYFEGQGYVVTWAFGHLVTLKDIEEYDPSLKRWTLASLPFIPKEFELKIQEDQGVKKQFAIIKKLFKQADSLICATDAGREGELIFRYIQELCSCIKKPWKRLWLSSLTDEALKIGFQNLKDGREYDNLYAAARCRSESDWIVGLNATRNCTVRYGQGKMLWSVGRVQTPVLAMIVNRDHQIRYFVSEPFWELCTKYRDVEFKLKGERFLAKDKAEAELLAITGHPFVIDKVSIKKEQELVPQLYDLTELQRDMNRRYDLTAQETLQIAQELYEKKFITYPRTDSRYITHDMKSEVASVLRKLQQVRQAEISLLQLDDLQFSPRVVNDKKVSDHHAILPTGKIPSLLQEHSRHVYEAIVTRLIAQFYPVCKKELTLVEGVTCQRRFQSTGTRIIDPGWMVLYPKSEKKQKIEGQKTDIQEASSQNAHISVQFEKGETGGHVPFITEGKTKAPSHYTENSLLGAMETAGKFVEDESLKEALKEKGIGTPATRAAIIETLIKRKYIERRGKSLVALESGRFLIALLQDAHLKSPELTGEWECKLKEIEKGAFQSTQFMQEIGEFTKKIVRESDILAIDETKYGECPLCKSAIMKGKRGYGCSKWQSGCGFVLWKEYNSRELDEWQIRALLQKRVFFDVRSGTLLTLFSDGIVDEISFSQCESNRGNKSFQKGSRTGKSRTVKLTTLNRKNK